MNRIAVVALKEIRQLTKSRNILISSILFVVIFGGFSGPAVLAGDAAPGEIMDQLLFYLILVLGIFSAFLFCGQVFLREKQDGVVETLLCSPLSLKEIWLGKVAGIVIPATLLTYLAAAVVILVGSVAIGEITIPSPALIVYVIVVVPAFIGAAAGLMGFAQLMLGMRENQVLNFVIIFGLIFLISLTGEIVGPFLITPGLFGVSLALAGMILLVTSWLTRFLSRERIVTTLPD